MAESNADGCSVFSNIANESDNALFDILTEDAPKPISTIDKFGQNQLLDSVPVKSEVLDRIRCPECERYTASSEEQLQRHIRKIHRGENPFQCYMCDYSTYNKAVFEEHIRVHKGIKPFKCSFCNYASASKKNAKNHESRHRPDNPLRCTICGFIGRNNKSLLAHTNANHIHESSKTVTQPHIVNSETGNQLVICTICTAKFSSNEDYLEHKKYINKCEKCPYHYCDSKDYLKHIEKCPRSRHKAKGISKRKVKENAVLFRCVVCKWSCSSKPKILLHLIHHPNQDVDKSIDISLLKRMQIMK